MAISVNVFNASPFAASLRVNSGGNFQVAGAGLSTNWTPQTPASNPGFAPGPPSPGNLGFGTNMINVALQGSPSSFMIPVDLSGNVNWMSIQIYLFPSFDRCPWLLLNNGQPVAQGTAS